MAPKKIQCSLNPAEIEEIIIKFGCDYFYLIDKMLATLLSVSGYIEIKNDSIGKYRVTIAEISVK